MTSLELNNGKRDYMNNTMKVKSYNLTS